jgi:hypothetical protein
VSPVLPTRPRVTLRTPAYVIGAASRPAPSRRLQPNSTVGVMAQPKKKNSSNGGRSNDETGGPPGKKQRRKMRRNRSRGGGGGSS